MDNVLIVDAGGTSTTWALLNSQGRLLHEVKTGPMNLSVGTDEQHQRTLKEARERGQLNMVSNIYFYGAGCLGSVKHKLPKLFGMPVEAASDMMGAARALLGRKSGIAAILGTGANTCVYDGEKITANIPPLGFILGDEGSGAALGKRFLRHLLRGELPDAIAADLHLMQGEVIQRVYREPAPNTYLASFTPFIRQHLDVPEVAKIVADEFDSFFANMGLRYPESRIYPISFIGSVAYYFKPQLVEAAQRAGMVIGKIEADPMLGLIRYHFNETD